MASQNQRLLQYLKTHRKGITSGEAHLKLGIMRLSERCAEIEGLRDDTHNVQIWRNRGYVVLDRQRERVKGRFGYATVTRYRLK